MLDFFFSFWVAMGTLPVPPDTGAYGAHGNVATCAAQGMFLQWGSVTPIYMMSLSIFFLLSIISGKKDSDLSKKYEPLLHAIPIFVLVATSIAGLVMEVFNPIGLPEFGCWLGEYPAGCTINGSTPCRGELMAKHNAAVAWSFGSGPLFTSFLVILVANFWINKLIRDQEKRNKSYTVTAAAAASTHFLREDGDSALEQLQGGYNSAASQSVRGRLAMAHQNAENTDSSQQQTKLEQQQQNSTSALQSIRNMLTSARQNSTIQRVETSEIAKAAAFQSLLYVSSAFMTVIWQFLPWFLYEIQVDHNKRYYVNVMSAFIFPLQGLFTLLIYIRPRYIRHRNDEPDVSRFRLFVRSLHEAP